MNTHTYNPSHPVYCACNVVAVAMTNEEKLAVLQAEFPALGLSFGYIGNYYGIPGTPAFRDDTAWRVFTNQEYATRGLEGRSFSVDMPRGELDLPKARRVLVEALASGRIVTRVYRH